MILAIDTSGPFCSAAFLDCASSQIIAQKSDDIGRGHAELLLPMIEGLMDTEINILQNRFTCGHQMPNPKRIS